MRIILLLIALFIFTHTYAQHRQGPGSYYKRYNPKSLRNAHIETIWLNESDAIPVIVEEMKKAGLEMLSSSVIIKVDSGKYVVPVCYSEKSKFGFLWEDTHGMFPNENNRELVSLYKSQTGYDYAQKIVPGIEGGRYEFMKIKTIPSNLYILKADCYCYQKTDNPKDDKQLVTKAFILSVLRQDIRNILKKRL